MSNESGTDEIYVKPYPAPGERGNASRMRAESSPYGPVTGGNCSTAVGNAMMAVSVVAGPTTSFGQPRAVSRAVSRRLQLARPRIPTTTSRATAGSSWSSEPASATTKVVFVQNWAEELKRLVPTK